MSKQEATKSLTELLATYSDGDGIGWAAEFSHLRVRRAGRLAELWESMATEGIKVPVLLGYDMRVWDGHHRLCVAHDLGIEQIPVDFSSPRDDLEHEDAPA